MKLMLSVAVLCAVGLGQPLAPAADEAQPGGASAAGLEFYEKKIRPLLAENCFECHGEQKHKGGLRLDSREGWATGGDSGPALVPGAVEASRLIKAVRYRDKEFQMPPKQRLSAQQVADLEQWIKLGAPAPRTAPAVAVTKRPGLSLEEGRKHWAYQPPQKPAPPAVKDAAWPRGDLDRFILAKLEAKGLKPVADADPQTLGRRIYFDLIGLPPTPEEAAAFVKEYEAGIAHQPAAIAQLVDRLLASPHYGERWGRHWLDVARYAESVTLRGFVFPEAWRYRDYVIAAFNRDLPYDRFMREQVSGDLLPAANVAERARQLTATTFLTMGNNVYEEQDKKQLEMDAIDEQLDVISKAFLAQTVTCARCHDHKFDPIPTRDYYALAGILKNSRLLSHENVSKWIEVPLPLAPEAEEPYLKQEAQLAALKGRLQSAKEAAAKRTAASGKEPVPTKAGALATKDFPGVVVDDAQAKVVGNWRKSQFGKNYIGDGYLEDEDKDKGSKTLTFIPELPRPGKYEVRLAFLAAPNRATNTPVIVFSADGERTFHINQRVTPPIEGRFVSLGQHKFELNGQGFVIVANEGTQGHVVADAVQFLPVEMLETLAAVKSNGTAKATTDLDPKPGPIKKTAAAKNPSAKPAKTTDEDVKKLEEELKQLTESGPKRPMVMTVKEEPQVGDIRVLVRGSVHNPGDLVPRGFLQIATLGPTPVITPKESGRRELGEWLASRENPLPARVMANRVWHWLTGAGLVRTTDNFGTMGEAPSHPELLDYLATRFVAEGWSVKKLVREVVLSRTYQLASGPSVQSGKDGTKLNGRKLNTESLNTEYFSRAAAADPENRLCWRANRRRLDAECIRDTVLAVSGQLQLAVGGATIKGTVNADYGYQHTDTRRSVYAPVFRNALPELFAAFDFADPSVVSGKRNTSIVAPQALFLLNHPFVREQAKAAARGALAAAGDDAKRIERAYRTALGRPPTAAETKLALTFLSAPADGQEIEGKRLDAWAEFYQALFASLDFRYLN